MKVVIINKSDSTGGAAVVSRRLMEALREEGVDARMLVVEKLSDSPYVEVAASKRDIKRPFLAERLKIFVANGFNRSTLFKIDTASDGLPLWEHPLVADADAILLNWVNQGMLSLRGVEKIMALGKPVIWTMHDMWCMTGVCHHAGECEGYKGECGECPLLGRMKGEKDISRKTWLRKRRLGRLRHKIRYVAVSRWLAEKAALSSLLRHQSVTVIPNAFRLPELSDSSAYGSPADDVRGKERINILFGAARLDDPIKNLPALVEMTKALSRDYPDVASRLQLVTFGNVKSTAALDGIAIPHKHLGMLKGEEIIRKVYEKGDIVVSSSSYETLPGTLVEAQAYGCIPVSFNQGGQSDIVDHLSSGYIAEYSEDPAEAGRRLAEGVIWAVAELDTPDKREAIIKRMRQSVRERFSSRAVARSYLELIQSSIGS